jgi:hypothetical protein
MNKIFLVKDQQELAGKVTGIIPAIVAGHMQAPAIFCNTDYSVFKKDDKEKGELLTHKMRNKLARSAAYGSDAHLYLNVPGGSLAESIHRTF